MLIPFFIIQILKTAKPENFQRSVLSIYEDESYATTRNLSNTTNESKCNKENYIHKRPEDRDIFTLNDKFRKNADFYKKTIKGLDESDMEYDVDNLIDTTLLEENQNENTSENLEDGVNNKEIVHDLDIGSGKNRTEHEGRKRNLSISSNKQDKKRKVFLFGRDDKILSDTEKNSNEEIKSEDSSSENNNQDVSMQKTSAPLKQINIYPTIKKKKTGKKGKYTLNIKDEDFLEHINAYLKKFNEAKKVKEEKLKNTRILINKSEEDMTNSGDKGGLDVNINRSHDTQQFELNEKPSDALDNVSSSQSSIKSEDINKDIEVGNGCKLTPTTEYRKPEKEFYVKGTKKPKKVKKKKIKNTQQIEDILNYINFEFRLRQKNNREKQFKKPNETTGIQVKIPPQNIDDILPGNSYLEAVDLNESQKTTNNSKTEKSVESGSDRHTGPESKEELIRESFVSKKELCQDQGHFLTNNDFIFDSDFLLSYLGLNDSSNETDDESEKFESGCSTQNNEDNSSDDDIQITIDQDIMEKSKQLISSWVNQTFQVSTKQNIMFNDNSLSYFISIKNEDLISENAVKWVIEYQKLVYEFENSKKNIYDYFFENMMRITEEVPQRKDSFIFYEEHNYISMNKNKITVSNKLNLQFNYQDNILRYKIINENSSEPVQNMTYKKANADKIINEHLKVRFLIDINGIFGFDDDSGNQNKEKEIKFFNDIRRQQVNDNYVNFPNKKLFHGLDYVGTNDSNVFYNIFGLKRDYNKIIFDHNSVKDTEKIRAKNFPLFESLGSYTQFLNECITCNAVDKFFLFNRKFNSEQCKVPEHFFCSPWIIEDYHEDTKLKIFRYFGVYNKYTGKYRFKVVMDNVCQNEHCLDFSDPYTVFEFEQFHHEFLVVTRIHS